MTDRKIIKPDEINNNVFKLIGDEWMLVTAGNMESFNMMTASWGGLGVLWNKNVSFTRCSSFLIPEKSRGW